MDFRAVISCCCCSESFKSILVVDNPVFGINGILLEEGKVLWTSRPQASMRWPTIESFFLRVDLDEDLGTQIASVTNADHVPNVASLACGH
jgi:hypothetical protein